MKDVLLFLHIVGAAGWIGGGMFGVYGTGRLAKAGGASNGRALEIIVEKAGVYFTIMFLLVVGAGVGLVFIDDQWGWGDKFIWVGVGAVVASGVWQGLVAGKADQRLLESIKSEDPARIAILGAWRRTAWVDVFILLVAIWVMVAKPSF
jgi:uncharacterized membrane protein